MKSTIFYVKASAKDKDGKSIWQPTDINLDSRQDFSIVAVGYASGVNPITNYHDPSGVCLVAPKDFLAPGLHAGALVGKVGNDDPKEFGNNWNGDFKSGGELMLGFNDSVATNNSGGFMVTITY